MKHFPHLIPLIALLGCPHDGNFLGQGELK